MRTRPGLLLLLASLFTTLLLPQAQAQNGASNDPSTSASVNVKRLRLGNIKNLCQVDDLYCSGQFAAADIDELKMLGLKCIVTFRHESEINWDEQKEVESNKIEFVRIPIGSPADLTDETFERVRKQLSLTNKRTLIHCGVGIRAAAAWLPFRVLDQGIELEVALLEAAALGLEHPGFLEKAKDYIHRARQEVAPPGSSEMRAPQDSADTQEPDNATETEEKSVKPGINDSFLDENLSVEEFVKRFEIESREIFLSREKILAACGLKKGMSVADIGAGTGLFSRLFSVAVGDEGWVYAIDIAPRFIEHINNESIRFGLSNISAILCTEKSAHLPTESVDVVFVCDTYHHFEYPFATLATIHRGLKPGGSLIIVDFERIPGVSREWTLDHVRAGKEVVREEIESLGFEFVEEQNVPGLEENYFLKFRKLEKTQQ